MKSAKVVCDGATAGIYDEAGGGWGGEGHKEEAETM